MKIRSLCIKQPAVHVFKTKTLSITDISRNQLIDWCIKVSN